jgi:hypothetical protein
LRDVYDYQHRKVVEYMEFKFGVTGARRKELAIAIGEILDLEPEYKGAPTYAYVIGEFTVNKEGTLCTDEVNESTELEKLLNELDRRGFQFEASDELVIELPMEGFSESALVNLERLVKSKETLINSVLNCCIPTHNTSTALEAAMAYAFALKTAIEAEHTDMVIHSALEGAAAGLENAPYRICAASSAERIKYLMKIIPGFKTGDELLDFLFDIYGAGLESEDICPAVFGIFLYAKDDVWLAIRLAASMGGDTDTVAALSGALCCAFAKRHNIPHSVLTAVTDANQLDFLALSADIYSNHK